MDTAVDNLQKYVNYREQMTRLKKALNAEFYLEAIFIEYSILEDRLESILRHSEKWNPKPNEFVSIERKINKVRKLAEEKKSLANRYFSKELMDAIWEWKEKRNPLMHALLKKNLHTEDLSSLALEGERLVKAASQ